MTNKLIIKNPTTTQHYSLAEKTLIQLPSASNENVISFGIEQGVEIQLDVPFDKIRYVQNESTVLGSGKVFEHTLNITENTQKITL